MLQDLLLDEPSHGGWNFIRKAPTDVAARLPFSCSGVETAQVLIPASFFISAAFPRHLDKMLGGDGISHVGVTVPCRNTDKSFPPNQSHADSNKHLRAASVVTASGRVDVMRSWCPRRRWDASKSLFFFNRNISAYDCKHQLRINNRRYLIHGPNNYSI